MFKRLRRERNLLSILLAGAMIFSSCIPVMGGETAATMDSDSSDYIYSDYFDMGDTYSEDLDGKEEIEADSDDGDISVLESGTTTSTNYYYGTVYVTKDGIYDGYPNSGSTKKLETKGISYDSDTHTLTLDNFSLGAVVDDFMSPDKSGTLEFSTMNNGFTDTDITIVLKGHNYIGGYSTYSRASYTPGVLEYAIYGTARSVIIEGDGDLLVNGGIDVWKAGTPADFRTALPVWSTYDFEGANIRSVSINDDGFYPNSSYYYRSNDHTELDCYGYTQIGGERPDTPYKPESYITVSKNLGTIGGHTVSVCYTDNIPYEGRKIVKKEGYMLVYNNATGEYEFYNPLDAVYGHWETEASGNQGWYAGRSLLSRRLGQKDDSASKAFRMGITVYVDGKPIWNPFVTAKYKNNLNAAQGTSVSPCFAFSLKGKDGLSALKDKDMYKEAVWSNTSENTITQEKIKNDLKSLRSSGFDKGFINAINAYFKNPDNWIRFTILPVDIKYTGFKSKKYADNNGDAATYRLNRITRDKAYDGYGDLGVSREQDSPKILADYKKKIKIKNGTVIKFPLCGQSLWKGKSDNLKEHTKSLKWDKKYTGGNPDPKKDFHVTVSDNCLIVTGQGNYINSITVPNPYS